MLSCENCIHLRLEVEGNGITEPRETLIECYHDEEEDIGLNIALEDPDLQSATFCTHYNAGECKVCGKPIGYKKVRQIQFLYNDSKVCSKECEKIEKAKSDKEYNEWKKDYKEGGI